MVLHREGDGIAQVIDRLEAIPTRTLATSQDARGLGFPALILPWGAFDTDVDCARCAGACASGAGAGACASGAGAGACASGADAGACASGADAGACTSGADASLCTTAADRGASATNSLV